MHRQEKVKDTALLKKLLNKIYEGNSNCCPSCGKDILPHWKYCPNDGEKI